MALYFPKEKMKRDSHLLKREYDFLGAPLIGTYKLGICLLYLEPDQLEKIQIGDYLGLTLKQLFKKLSHVALGPRFLS